MLAATLLAIAASGSSQTTPALPGGIIAWVVCNARKRNAIGGWLLFYYWQVYSSIFLSVIFFSSNIQSYVPENFDTRSRFVLFLISAVPGVLALLIQTTVATITLGVQTSDMLKLLRAVLIAQVLVEALAIAIDAAYFPDNLIFPTLMLIQEGLWLAYFFRSIRVSHVFALQNWQTAVDVIYPRKLQEMIT